MNDYDKGFKDGFIEGVKDITFLCDLKIAALLGAFSVVLLIVVLILI